MSEEIFAIVMCLFILVGWGVPATTVYVLSREMWRVENRLYAGVLAALWPITLIVVTLLDGKEWE